MATVKRVSIPTYSPLPTGGESLGGTIKAKMATADGKIVTRTIKSEENPTGWSREDFVKSAQSGSVTVTDEIPGTLKKTGVKGSRKYSGAVAGSVAGATYDMAFFLPEFEDETGNNA